MSIRVPLALATAQFDSNTGLFARTRVSEAQTRAVVEGAAAAQINSIDVAAAHPDVERTLGVCWPFPSPFQVCLRTLPIEDSVDRVEQRARRSLAHLGLARGHALIVQDAGDLLGRWGHELWTRLRTLKDEGLFQKIGVSLTSDDEPVHFARRFRPDIVQMPCSLLDQRPVQTGTLAALADQGVEIQLRSVFLSGLLFMPREDLPATVADAGPRLSRVRRMLAEAGADPMRAALAFAQSQPEASAVIVGARSPEELRALLAASTTPAPALNWSEFALEHPVALDPRRWASATEDLSTAA